MLDRRKDSDLSHWGIRSFILLLLCFSSLACASEQELTVEAKVDKTAICAGEVIAYSIVLKGTMKQQPQIKMPALEDFEVISTSRAFNIAVDKEKRKSTFQVTYILKPRSEGKLSIGPAEIEHSGKIYTTDTIAIEVKPSENKKEEPQTPGPEEKMLPKESGLEIII